MMWRFAPSGSQLLVGTQTGATARLFSLVLGHPPTGAPALTATPLTPPHATSRTPATSRLRAQRCARFAESLAPQSPDEQEGNIDSLLLWHDGSLLLEAYYRRGRANYPHYQMSITKSYTAMAIGRAIELFPSRDWA